MAPRTRIMVAGLCCGLAMLSACGGPGDDAMLQAPSSPSTLPVINKATLQAKLSPNELLQMPSFADYGSTTVSGSVVGWRSRVWAIPVLQGQLLTVSMNTDNPAAFFDVYDMRGPEPVAVYRGDTGGPTANIQVPIDTTFVIRPFMPDGLAERGTRIDYSLSISRN